MKQSVVLALLLCLASLVPNSAARAAESAVVLAYHRFDDDRVPALNTTTELLAAHVAELKSGGYAVLPLAEMVSALRAGRALPDKAVAITVDEASAGFYAGAWPLLKKAGLPVTLFLATDEVDRGGPEVMTWGQIRDLAAAGVEIGVQGAARLRMSKVSSEQISADLVRAKARLDKELGKSTELFAWPWGEASAEAEDVLRRSGIAAAFGQHSGAAWAKGDPFFLPRFVQSSAYGDMQRFRLSVRSLPLPAVDITPEDPAIKVNPPAFGFTLAEDVPGIDGLSCFASHQGQVKVERLGPRVEVRMSKPIPSGRGRLNCTVPALEGRWRWFGWQFAVP
ncbi:polysaccharide deacetylase family protein [Paramagnetospirillum magnetotacticum]|uniref:polysaccharide deacetylase family protein n=1 Tax=Paramagnetospirillum magnetotacticum TaxID=188 RepID=UPI00069825D7|nr:polysaccharide deacetylase family protein [Paramagnetospirillum magnetotacticum]